MVPCLFFLNLCHRLQSLSRRFGCVTFFGEKHRSRRLRLPVPRLAASGRGAHCSCIPSRWKQELARVTYCMAETWGEGAGQEPPVWLGPRPQARRRPCPTAGRPHRSLHLSALGEKSTWLQVSTLPTAHGCYDICSERRPSESRTTPSILGSCLSDFGFSGTSLSCNLTLSDRILASTLLPNVAHSISLIYPWVYCCFWSRSVLQFSILPLKTDTINCKCGSF